MGRPTSKPELMAAAEHEFDRLWAAVRAVSPSELETPGACDSWSVKDLLAHLDAWHRMWLRWEQAGARGDPTSMPDEGFTWRYGTGHVRRPLRHAGRIDAQPGSSEPSEVRTCGEYARRLYADGVVEGWIG